jgi:hypothetical protein
LRQRRNRAPDHLEGQLGQLKFLRQSVQNPVAALCMRRSFCKKPSCQRTHAPEAELIRGSQQMGNYERCDYVKVEFLGEITGIGEWMWVIVTRCDE